MRFFVLGAVYDTDVKGARTLRTALKKRAPTSNYDEVPEGHAAETFRAHIDDALRRVAAGARSPDGRGSRLWSRDRPSAGGHRHAATHRCARAPAAPATLR